MVAALPIQDPPPPTEALIDPTYQIGAASVTRIDELVLAGTDPASLYPGLDDAALAEFGSSLTPGSCDPATGHFTQSIHSWLVRLAGQTILVDAATGNGKHLPTAPMLNQLDEPFLERLAAAGVEPDDVDLVLMTHLHSDHVGRNTRLRDGRWEPTFRCATHIFSAIEQRYNAALARGEPIPD